MRPLPVATLGALVLLVGGAFGACSPFSASGGDGDAGSTSDAGPTQDASTDGTSVSDGGGGEGGPIPVGTVLLEDTFEAQGSLPRAPWDDLTVQQGGALMLVKNARGGALSATWPQAGDPKSAYLYSPPFPAPGQPYTVELHFRALATVSVGQWAGPRLRFCTLCGMAGQKRLDLVLTYNSQSLAVATLADGLADCTNNCFGIAQASANVGQVNDYELRVEVTRLEAIVTLRMNNALLGQNKVEIASKPTTLGLLMAGDMTLQLGATQAGANVGGTFEVDEVTLTRTTP